MAYIHSIFKDISNFINPSVDQNLLISKLKDENLDWELLVKSASQQLVLTTIYCNLKSKSLLGYLPTDLCNYLEEITDINRNRNLTILEEIKEISLLLNNNQIDHVFVKGAALLASGYYNDLGERMVGDIDILVHPDQIYKAQELMIEKGYKGVDTTFGHDFFEPNHLPRLIPDTNLAAVEIHRELLHKTVKDQLQPSQVLKNKQIINNIAMPNQSDLLKHAVLNFQINDFGYAYNYLGLRNAYDVLILLPKLNKSEFDDLLKTKIISSFLSKMTNYFELSYQYPKTIKKRLKNSFFLLKQKNKLVSTIWYKIVNLFNLLALIINRLFLFVGNANYRKESFRDRKRIIKLLKSRI